MELKIRIKETKTERRHLTREQWALIVVFQRTEKGSVNKNWAKEAIDEHGIDLDSVRFEIPRYGMAEFTTETIRDATRDEIHAWHYREMAPNCVPDYLKKHLDKNYILELI